MDYQPFNKIYLLSNVNIDSSYNHEFYFENDSTYPSSGKSGKQKQYEFFYSKRTKSLEPGTYQRKNIGTIQVPFLAEEIATCKYLMWKNLLNEDGTIPSGDTRPIYDGWIYAFIDKIEYVNPNVSTIYYTIDVYQTYLFDMTWQQSFIDREHVDRWTSVTESGTTYTIPTINVEEENLDYGSNYRIVNREEITQIPDVSFMILGCTKRIDDGTTYNDLGWVGQLPGQLYYYIVPICTSSKTRVFVFNRATTLADVTAVSVNKILKLMATNTTYVNSLVSCTIVPFLPFNIQYTYPYTEGSYSQLDAMKLWDSDNDNLLGLELSQLSGYYVWALTPSNAFDEVTKTSSQRIYANFPNYTESKLLMYPYSFTELTNEHGDYMILKNEYINSGVGNITIKILSSLGSTTQYKYLINNYLGTGYYLENGLGDTTQVSVPILDDYTASYIQSNYNAIEVAKSNALATYEQTNKEIKLTEDKKLLQVVTSVGGGVLDLLTGNFSVADTANTIVEGVYASKNADLSRQGNDVDYNNTINTLLAKQQDAENIPATVKSNGNDYIFNNSYNCNKLYLIKKTIVEQYATKLTSYFNMYGYKVNKAEVPNFHTRRYWNYIKMAQPNVLGNIPMDDLNTLKAIFTNGITLWHSDNVGNYTLSNTEV